MTWIISSVAAPTIASWLLPTAVVSSSLASGLMASNATSNAANAQREGMTEQAYYQMLMNDNSVAATLEAAGMSADAIRYGADMAHDSAMAGIEAQLQMYNQARTDQMPWMKIGKKALKTLRDMTYAGPGEFEESPGYQFRLDQGNANILGNASATGGIASGRTLKALNEYGQDYASNEYANFLSQYYNSLIPFQNLATMGQAAASGMGAMGIQTGQGISNSYNNLANSQVSSANSLANIYANQGIAQASGYQNTGNILGNYAMGQGNISATNSINQANAWTGALNSGMNMYGQFGSGFNTTPYNNYTAIPSFGSNSWYQPSTSYGMAGMT